MELHSPTPELSDGVVLLREWKSADAPQVAVACRDTEIVRWTTQIPEGYTLEHAEDWIASTPAGWANGTAELAITEQETGAIAGAIALIAQESWMAEIGYWIAAPYRNKGLATRALNLVSGWGEKLGFIRLQLTMLPGNESSARVARECCRVSVRARSRVAYP